MPLTTGAFKRSADSLQPMKAIAEAFGLFRPSRQASIIEASFLFEPKVTRRRGWNRSEEAIAFAFNLGFYP
ncbi:hypothetical protein [Paenibacillus sp. TY11]|uniref:hypothetical protein n=1 Tax=Paenibacillus sp. TY11 TaxID=3448633 RepID=UPI00403A2221